MRRGVVVALLAVMLGVAGSATAQEEFPELGKRVPYLTQRLNSPRWIARYGLLGELDGRDPDTKRVLETLANDPNESVANQALAHYVRNFLKVERTLFKPELYARGRFPLGSLPAENADRALVDYCLGRREIVGKAGCFERPIPVLDAAHADDPGMHQALTIVGILGNPEDSEALYPFLESGNPYVALGAAQAVLRLGDEAKGAETLCRLTELEPTQHLFYVTEALHILREIGHPRLREIVPGVLSSIDQSEAVQQPNWVNGFLLLAADVVGEDVWRDSEAEEPK